MVFKMDSIYELKKVSKIYKSVSSKTYALNNVDLTINRGEVIVILGPSGSGKSTLLNILSGIDKVSKGEVFYDSKNLNDYKEEELTKYRRDNLGFIFQSYNLISNLTVIENVMLGEHLSTAPLKMDKILKTVGLYKEKDKYPFQLSGGQMQRVSIARALIKNPNVLFCDEPTGALDEETGKTILKSLADINNKFKTTLIIVTHNPSIALMADTVIKMNSGKIESITKNKVKLNAEELRWA